MFRTLVLTLLCLFVTVASPFSWDFVVGGETRLYFYYKETIQLIEELPLVTKITSITYDTVHNRLFFSDINYTRLSISSFNLSTRKIESLLNKTTADSYVRVVYDPVTQLLVWKERLHIYTFSLKPRSPKKAFNFDGKPIISFEYFCRDIAVDSCGGYIYWVTDTTIERARLDGSEKEVLLNRLVSLRTSLAIDQQTQRIYWIERKFVIRNYEDSIESSYFDGKNQTTLYVEKKSYSDTASSMAVSKDFIYWQSQYEVETWQLPKVSSNRVAKKLLTISDLSDWSYQLVAANYTIQEQTQGIKSCKALQGLIPNNSKPESTVVICQNYCFEGDCIVNAEGQPICRCKTGYSGERCEVNTCQSYCLNSGVCSLNENDQPVCRCSEDYDGNRCEFPAYFVNCIQTVAMLRDVLSADVPSVTLSTAVKSPCTVV